MKKIILIAAAASTALIYSCGDDKANDGKLTQEQMDSMKQATIDSMNLAKQREADSILAAQNAATLDSLRVADSIKAATGKEPSPAAVNAARPKTPKPSTNSKPAPSNNNTPVENNTPAKEEPKTVGNGKPSMKGNTNDGTVGNGKPSMKNNNNDGTVGNGKPSMKDNN